MGLCNRKSTSKLSYFFQDECLDALEDISRKINTDDADMRSHVILSMVKVAAAEADVPPMPSSAMTSFRLLSGYQSASSSSASNASGGFSSYYGCLLLTMLVQSALHATALLKSSAALLVLTALAARNLHAAIQLS